MKTEKPRPTDSAAAAPAAPARPAVSPRPWEDRTDAQSPRRLANEVRALDRQLMAWLGEDLRQNI